MQAKFTDMSPYPQNDESKDTWPREAVVVDGQIRWKTENGPGDTVSGEYDYVFLEEGRRLLLTPKSQRQSSETLQQTLSGQQPVGSGGRLTEELGEQELLEAVDSLVRDLPHGEGGFYAKYSSTQYSESEFARKYLMSLVRNGRRPQACPIAVDVHGNLDVDHDTEGPEISPEGQMTGSGYLYIENSEELAKKKRKERKRMLASVSDPKEGDLYEEDQQIKRSSSISSVSDVSWTNYEESHNQNACGSECPLRKGDDLQTLSSLKLDQTISTHALPHDHYAYEQIEPNWTRVVALEPGERESALMCKLLPMPIDNVETNMASKCYDGAYEALSYTWGAPIRNQSLICCGKQLPITENLHSALLHLRLPGQPRFLWIDAICIDQKSTLERSTQIRHMEEIYRRASGVIIWLGSNASNSDVAIGFVEDFNDKKTRNAILTDAHEKPCYERLEQTYRALIALIHRPYFRRSWIRQEIAVARKIRVHCGRSQCSWYALKRSIRRLPSIRGKFSKGLAQSSIEYREEDVKLLQNLKRGWVYGQAIMNPFGQIRSIWYYHAGGLLDFLMVGRAFDATDPRDKVYSVLGIARIPMTDRRKDERTSSGQNNESRNVPAMEIDYSKSVSEVYQDVVKYLINRDQNLDILCILSTHRDENSCDLPSWVPDWRVSLSHAALKDCWDYIGCKFGAGGLTHADHQPIHEYGQLRVTAYLVDTVRELLDVTCRTTEELFHIEDSATFRQYTEPLNDDGHGLRRLCVSALQCLCFVPSATQVRDFLCVLEGGKLPFVLRPRSPAEKEGDYFTIGHGAEFEMVGPCCVPHLMYGRTITLSQDGQLQPLQIVLV